jgi:hypothetical protein
MEGFIPIGIYRHNGVELRYGFYNTHTRIFVALDEQGKICTCFTRHSSNEYMVFKQDQFNGLVLYDGSQFP